jgi:hypothetical protein
MSSERGVPKDIREKNKLVQSGNLMKYMVGLFEDPTTKKPVRVFLHEAVWVLENGLIPDDKLVSHIDGDARNNNLDNLKLVDENKEHGDLHTRKFFHQSTVNTELIKEHFPDIHIKIN